MKNWNTYRLGDFLQRQYDSVTIDDFSKYKRITIKTKGQGIELRDEVVGIEIGTKKQFKVKKNQFLLSKIDAMNGAFGIVPQECDEGIITGNFWTYNLNEEIIDREYLRLLCIKQEFTKFSLVASEGTTSRKYLREVKFLNLSIYLPPILEQRRIISKINKFTKRIELIKRLKSEQEKEIHSFSFSIFIDIEKKFNKKTFGSFLVPSDNLEEPVLSKNYRQVGVRWWGGGAYERETIDGSQTSYKYFVRLEKNNFLFNKIWVRHGALAIIKDETVGCYASGEFPVYRYDEKEINPKWIDFIINLPIFWQRCSNLSQGTSGKNRIKPSEFLKMEIPIPPLVEQNRIVVVLGKIKSIKNFHNATDREFLEMIPALFDKAVKGEL